FWLHGGLAASAGFRCLLDVVRSRRRNRSRSACFHAQSISTPVVEALVSSACQKIAADTPKVLASSCVDTILTAFHCTDSFILGKELEVKTEVSIEYCVV